MKSKKQYWIAEKHGETSRIAKYASSLFGIIENGFTLRRGHRPEKYIYITVRKGGKRP